tara:strand:- start:81 stop:386 length:306 start_codon:yes stop_codon:yes gene_type:complete
MDTKKRSIPKPRTVYEKVFWDTAKIIYEDISYPHSSNIMLKLVSEIKKIDPAFRLDVLDAEDRLDTEYYEKLRAMNGDEVVEVIKKQHKKDKKGIDYVKSE